MDKIKIPKTFQIKGRIHWNNKNLNTPCTKKCHFIHFIKLQSYQVKEDNNYY